MDIRLAKTAGFCMGVKRAVQISLQTARSQDNLFTCGPLIHNPQAVAALREKGIRSTREPDGETGGTMIIRAHGMPRGQVSRMRARGIRIVDATCPHVVASQNRIRKAAEQGFFIIIVGDPQHPEILSLQSFAPPDRHCIIADQGEAERFPGCPKAIVIAQTTYHEQKYKNIGRILTQKIPECKVFHSICKATSNRQEEITRLADAVDAVIVVGGRDSANTRRLAEIAAARGKPTFHVETALDLNLADFRGLASVGITAGASTPNWITQEVIQALRNLDRAEHPIRFHLNRLAELFRQSHASVALGAAGLAGFLLSLSRLGEGLALTLADARYPAVAFGLILALHRINPHWETGEEDSDVNSALHPPDAGWAWGSSPLIGSVLTWGILAATLGLAASLSGPQIIFVLLAVGLGLGQSWRILPPTLFPHSRCLRDLPGGTAISQATLLATVAGVLPILDHAGPPAWFQCYLPWFAFAVGFARNLTRDLREIEVDRIIDRNTLPTLWGKAGTARVIFLLTVSLLLGALPITTRESTFPLGVLLPGTALALLAFVPMGFRRFPEKELRFVLALDLPFHLLGLAALAHLLWVGG